MDNKKYKGFDLTKYCNNRTKRKENILLFMINPIRDIFIFADIKILIDDHNTEITQKEIIVPVIYKGYTLR